MARNSVRTFDLRGAVAVVTGAASGIGAALADLLARRGCDLALADVNGQGLGAVADGARERDVAVSEHVLDMREAARVAALPSEVLARHGRVSLLINNAGVALGGRFDQTSLEDFEWLFDVNFWGVVRATYAFLPVLRREPAAQIVNLSSVFGLIAPPGHVAYAASKFAVRGFSEALRHELDGSEVGVTVVHPAGIATAIAANARRGAGLPEEEARQFEDLFSKLLRIPPEQAAERIVRGVERREKRVLIGADAVQIDLIQRLLPVRYWGVLRAAMRLKLGRDLPL